MKTIPTNAMATIVKAQASPIGPLREIDDLDGIEDQQQAERDQRVDASKRQAVDNELAH